MCFPKLMLSKKPNVRASLYIKRLIQEGLDAWDQGWNVPLVDSFHTDGKNQNSKDKNPNPTTAKTNPSGNTLTPS